MGKQDKLKEFPSIQVRRSFTYQKKKLKKNETRYLIFTFLLNNTENVLTNLCTEHVQAILKLHIKTKNGLKIIQFLKIYISQSMQIFVPVKTQNAGMWMDTVTHTLLLKFNTKYSYSRQKATEKYITNSDNLADSISNFKKSVWNYLFNLIPAFCFSKTEVR